MAITNWTTETTTDHKSGQTTVTVTVTGPQSQPYQLSWVSGAPPPPYVVGSSGPAPNAMLGNADVVAETAVAGPQLLAAVNAALALSGTPPAFTVEANPDPLEM